MAQGSAHVLAHEALHAKPLDRAGAPKIIDVSLIFSENIPKCNMDRKKRLRLPYLPGKIDTCSNSETCETVCCSKIDVHTDIFTSKVLPGRHISTRFAVDRKAPNTMPDGKATRAMAPADGFLTELQSQPQFEALANLLIQFKRHQIGFNQYFDGRASFL